MIGQWEIINGFRCQSIKHGQTCATCCVSCFNIPNAVCLFVTNSTADDNRADGIEGYSTLSMLLLNKDENVQCSTHSSGTVGTNPILIHYIHCATINQMLRFTLFSISFDHQSFSDITDFLQSMHPIAPSVQAMAGRTLSVPDYHRL